MDIENPGSQKVEIKGAAPLLLDGHFRFRRLTESYALAKFLSAACPNPRLAIVGLTEVLVNAVEHGNLGITSEEKEKLQAEDRWVSEIERRLELPEYSHKFVKAKFRRTQTEIQLTVTDQGEGFNWQEYQKSKQTNQLTTHGRGILMAKELIFKKLEYSEKGNEVYCVISLTESLKAT